MKSLQVGFLVSLLIAGKGFAEGPVTLMNPIMKHSLLALNPKSQEFQKVDVTTYPALQEDATKRLNWNVQAFFDFFNGYMNPPVITEVSYTDNAGVGVQTFFDPHNVMMQCSTSSSGQNKSNHCTSKQEDFVRSVFAQYKNHPPADAGAVVSNTIKRIVLVGLGGSACTAIAVMLSKR